MGRRTPLPIVADARLPPAHARWAGAFLREPLPAEPFATCEDCAMVGDAREAARDAAFFNARTKCCTYEPRLPNFLVGRILRDGNALLEARLARAEGVSPLGIAPPRSFEALYAAEPFGQTDAIVCPYYEGGRCGIWRHRNGVCSSWYCKHARGDRGRKLWKALAHLLTTIEHVLARWCVMELDVGPQARETLLATPPWSGEKRPEIDSRAASPDALWGFWHGREREFFETCAALVDAVTWPQIERLGGVELSVAVRLFRDADDALRDGALPEAVRVGAFRVVAVDAEAARLVTYSQYDPIEIPASIFAALPSFEAAPVRALAIDEELLRMLIDFGVLVARR